MNKLRLRVVTYEEDGLWVAHSLEMDLIGLGETQDSAIQELRSNIEAQLSFAKHQQINPFRPAPEEIQKLWDENNLAVLGLGGEVRKKVPQRNTSVLQWSKRQISLLPSDQFQCA